MEKFLRLTEAALKVSNKFIIYFYAFFLKIILDKKYY